MDAIQRIGNFLVENLIGIVVLAGILIAMWTGIGVDPTRPNEKPIGLTKTVQNEVNSLVPPKK